MFIHFRSFTLNAFCDWGSGAILLILITKCTPYFTIDKLLKEKSIQFGNRNDFQKF